MIAEAECKQCGWIGPNHEFTDHAIKCMEGAPDPLPGEDFHAWAGRVKLWHREREQSKKR